MAPGVKSSRLARPAINKDTAPTLATASAKGTWAGRTRRASAVASSSSGTTTTKRHAGSRFKVRATTAPALTRATTRPPSSEAAAFSAWPSTSVAIARASPAPAAAAAASARAAEDPSPRESGISDLT